jgi:hypothetical protein
MIDTEDRGDDVEGEEEEGGETRTTRKVSPTQGQMDKTDKIDTSLRSHSGQILRYPQNQEV